MKTPLQKLQERTAKMAKYALEVEGVIGSPYRISEYVALRMKGVSKIKALEKVRV